MGVLKDNVMAYMWSIISATNGNENGAQGREIAASIMTREDVSKAQTLARECMASEYKECGY